MHPHVLPRSARRTHWRRFKAMGTTMQGATPGQATPNTTTDTTDKPTATLTAQLALRGHAVHRGTAGDFTVCKHGLARYCKDVGELQAFALQVGATQ